MGTPQTPHSQHHCLLHTLQKTSARLPSCVCSSLGQPTHLHCGSQCVYVCMVISCPTSSNVWDLTYAHHQHIIATSADNMRTVLVAFIPLTTRASWNHACVPVELVKSSKAFLMCRKLCDFSGCARSRLVGSLLASNSLEIAGVKA